MARIENVEGMRSSRMNSRLGKKAGSEPEGVLDCAGDCAMVSEGDKSEMRETLAPSPQTRPASIDVIATTISPQL